MAAPAPVLTAVLTALHAKAALSALAAPLVLPLWTDILKVPVCNAPSHVQLAQVHLRTVHLALKDTLVKDGSAETTLTSGLGSY